jgi:mRNA interferase HigB
MKVHLIKEKTIRNYVLANTSSKIPFEEWLTRLKKADWNKPADIKNSFPAVDLLGKSSLRVIFDIGGNNYRMICKYAFGETNIRLYVCWIGTHREYDGLCNKKEQFTVFIF